MCGIAGIVRFDDLPIDTDRLGAMLAHLKHRGPDGDGISEHGRCALVHTRLSIIDLLSGQQPMHLSASESMDGDRHAVPRRGSSGPLHLVFNGEIYNHKELRRKLEKRGHVFASTHSDTEVLLYGYRQWGENLPKHLHGMFAFAIWDEADRRLFMARDRAGKKPLFIRYSQDQRELVFASLVGTITAGLPADDKAQIKRQALLNYLRLGYTFGQSMVDGVNELPAAHFMRIEADGEVQIRRYWRPPPISKHSTALGAVDALDEVLTEAVEKRLEADVPLGCFLSGGIDSSVIAAIGQRRLGKLKAGRLRTFSVAMPDVQYDETPHAIEVANHIGAEHTVLQCEIGDAMADLKRLMAVTGEPTADSSLLPTHWLCKTARPHCKAALSGDGGDELFGGYDRYRAMRLLATHRGWIKSIPRGLLGGDAKSSRARLGRLVDAARAGSQPSEQYQSMIHLFTDQDIESLVPGLIQEVEPSSAGANLPNWQPWDDLAHAAMRWDFQYYLPFELLRKVDRAAMAVALEVRCPMLDTQVCDLAGHLPTKVLMPGGKPKALLRQLAGKYLPESICRRPKRGFAVPMGDWLRERLSDDLHDHLFDGKLDVLGVEAAVSRRMFEEHRSGQADHTHRLFSLLQLSLWCDWFETAPPPVPRVGID
ncbi:asparagine synthase (glutamine-hydrolyzing) [Algisphaera agarilytica]|uniref:asparagine synthase (glutamine-hydrolyzing) n=1 Tax=Algisphaera agarilytica TaxID=1385975 RepID=A0A7X0LM01_9BACT|nr:asparagine synthase (glutamine-hydrolyzing) [Algisphaera agarilytica]MBB6431444.1 asparagine synthase (glutamine-hydrolyzing) [Algisphaera agarilytica]